MMARIEIRLIKSTIGALPKQRATVRSLGLRKIGSSNIVESSPAVLGMVRAVAHLVSVKSAEEGSSGKGKV